MYYTTGSDKVGESNAKASRESNAGNTSTSTMSPQNWLEEVARKFGNVIPEGENDDDDDDDDIEEYEENSTDGLSTLSGSSLIRASEVVVAPRTRHEYPTIRTDPNTYTRCYMNRRAIREGRPRYAVKHLREDFALKRSKYDAAIDLAVEASFLKLLKHPNIIRIRGTVDKPGHDAFMIVMDCLNMTLREKMTDEWNVIMDTCTRPGWRSRRRNSSSIATATLRRSHVSTPSLSRSGEAPKNWFQKLIGSFNPPNYENDPVLKELYVEKLMAVYDLARALKFLSEKRILFRDLKPENVGFDVRSRVKLFDFGLSKELKDRDLMTPPDSYDATGLCGSRRYMSPEVCECKYYGFASDVYSYSIVFWEVFSGKIAYDNMSFNDHFEEVVTNGKRPNTKIPGMPKTVIKLMGQMWAPQPQHRPDFDHICHVLREESRHLRHDHNENGHHHHLSERTAYLMGQSARSQSNSAGPASHDE
jgi:serine/threonine protein kinase